MKCGIGLRKNIRVRVRVRSERSLLDKRHANPCLGQTHFYCSHIFIDIFDMNHRIIGQIHSVRFFRQTKCIKQSRQHYRRFWIFLYICTAHTHVLYYYYLSKMSWGDIFFFSAFRLFDICSPSFELLLF